MRRVLGGVLLGLGVLLVVGAALVKWVAAPALVKIPDDVNLTTVAQGSSQVFVLQAQAVQTVPVIATRIVRSDAKAGTSSVGVFDETLCLRNGAGTTRPGPDGCVPDTDPGFRPADDRPGGVRSQNGACRAKRSEVRRRRERRPRNPARRVVLHVPDRHGQR